MKEIKTFAHVQTSEEVAFFGVLADKYSKLFSRYKDDMSIIGTNPAMEFLASKEFSGYADNSFQKTDIIEELI